MTQSLVETHLWQIESDQNLITAIQLCALEFSALEGHPATTAVVSVADVALMGSDLGSVIEQLTPGEPIQVLTHTSVLPNHFLLGHLSPDIG